jgi:hypothetical protein
VHEPCVSKRKEKNTVAALSVGFCQAAKGNANRAGPSFPFHRGRFLGLRPALAVTQQPDRRRPFGCPVDVKECHRDEPRRVDGTRVYLRQWCADQRVLAGCDVATSQCDTHRRTSTPAVHVCKYPKTLTNLANSGKA